MPIRSPKGRGAAYRALWQWPLRSPARLFGCLALLVLVVLSLNAAFGLLPERAARPGIFGSGPSSVAPTAPAGPPALAGPPTPPAEPTRLPPVAELTPQALPVSKAPPAALTVASRWTQAWARHPAGTTTQAWVDGLRPYTTDEYLGVLATVDPANVPATKVTGAARAVLVSPRSVRVEVPTDVVTLVVLVINTGTEWRVAGYDRASGDNTTGDPAAGQPR